MALWTIDDTATPDDRIAAFLGGDTGCDETLADYDILGSIAHTQMLHEQGYLDGEELGDLHAVLHDLYTDDITVTAEDEDIHTVIEEQVTAETAAGKKMHTGRSRNDQVTVDERLYLKHGTVHVAQAALDLAAALQMKAADHGDAVMPGYTHMQQAMPTTVGTWLDAHAAAVLGQLQHLQSVHAQLDQNPLGAAAGYGTTLDIDRDRTAELLGFSTVQQNPIHAVDSRGQLALTTMQGLTQLMLTVDTLAQDLLLFSTDAYGFVGLPDDFCTGSSVMPQKSNPDVLELVQAKTAQVQGRQHTIEALCMGNTSGYGREMQAVTPAIVESIELTTATLQVLADLVEGLGIDQNAISESLDEHIYAAYTANQQVEHGAAFRDAYRTVKQEQEYDEPAVDDIPSTGIDADTLQEQQAWWSSKQEAWDETVDSLLALAEDNAAAAE
ncbi:MAG: argininosuccinate lyase [Candidatus Nanohaloarchaea archaeon]|nr:argininosuccinate lyase [Candidatus Nanohaloarchaea archaeon]